MEYIDLVLVKHPNNGNVFLFEAPQFSSIKAGDTVLCDTQYGEALGKVEDKKTVNESEIQFIVKSAGATLPLKRIIGTFDQIKYTETQEQTKVVADDELPY